MSDELIQSSPLGQRSAYIDTYDNTLLFPLLRQPKRKALGINGALPFKGYDLWTAFELSWLNLKGKPVVALADIIIPCESTYLIESKSFKLYLNSFNNTHYASYDVVRDTLTTDLSAAAGLDVKVTLSLEQQDAHMAIGHFEGFCLDDIDVDCTDYTVNPTLLRVSEEHVQTTRVYSHLLKSNCLVTGQPDWGSVQITYAGARIDEAFLLRYLVSYRNHNEFHEQCVERIFMDIQKQCRPESLTVYARYTRRGGLDINPIRSSMAFLPPHNRRLFRQ